MAMNRAEIRAIVQGNRRDPASLLHSPDDYNDAINKATRRVPERLWQREIDITVVTVLLTRAYALAGLAGLTKPGQVRRVWLEDSADQYNEIGRWEVDDDGGTITLMLDEDPPAADRILRIEYLRPHAALTDDGTDSTMDEDWLIAQTTVLLLLDADPRYEDPNLIAADLQRFDAARQARERELLAQTERVSKKVRTYPSSRFK
jgi:hypothetical protein